VTLKRSVENVIMYTLLECVYFLREGDLLLTNVNLFNKHLSLLYNINMAAILFVQAVVNRTTYKIILTMCSIFTGRI
jgi:hypothetical protein